MGSSSPFSEEKRKKRTLLDNFSPHATLASASIGYASIQTLDSTNTNHTKHTYICLLARSARQSKPCPNSWQITD